MEIKIKREPFLRALQKIQGIVEKRVTMPILSHCLVEVTESKGLVLTATDMEILLDTRVECSVKREGRVAVPARKMFEIVRDLPGDDINMKWKEGYFLEIKSAKSIFKITSLPADEFPSINLEIAKCIKIEAEALQRLIDRCFFAVSTDETRYNLNGIYFEVIRPDRLRAVATDGHRLSYHEYMIGEERLEKLLISSSRRSGIIIPRKGIQEIRRLISDEETVGINIMESSIGVEIEETRLIIRALDAEFPEYKQVIPRENNNRAKMAREDFLDAIKRVSIISSERTKAVKLDFRKGSLKISSVNPDIGEAEEEIDVEYNGSELAIAFNAKYIIDVLENSESSNVIMEMKDDLSPAVVKFIGEEDNLNIIMPMRI